MFESQLICSLHLKFCSQYEMFTQFSNEFENSINISNCVQNVYNSFPSEYYSMWIYHKILLFSLDSHQPFLRTFSVFVHQNFPYLAAFECNTTSNWLNHTL